jgi:hypothetical protein
VAPPDPWGPWCEQFWFYIISESFHVNMTYFGSVVLEKKIFKWTHPIFAFCDYLPFEEDLALYLNNLESPLPKDHLYQVWLKLASWFWRRRFFQISEYFYSFTIISPWRRAIPFIWTIYNPFPPRIICAKSGKNWHSSSGEEVENVKVYRQTDRRTEGRQTSFQLRWAKKEMSIQT